MRSNKIVQQQGRERGWGIGCIGLIFQLGLNHGRLIEGNSTMKTLPMEEAQVHCLQEQWIRCHSRNVSLKCYSTTCCRAKAQEVAIEPCKNSSNKAVWSKSQCCIQGPVHLTADTVRLGRAEIINGHCSNQISTWLGTTTVFCTNIPRKVMTWASKKKKFYILFLVLFCLYNLLFFLCSY